MRISELARRHGLSRSTLLYYGRIGILSPSERTPSGYRVYTTADEERICTYRRASVSLKEIQKILDAPAGQVTDVLRARLEELDGELEALRGQQRLLARLLGSGVVPSGRATMDKATWTSLLVASGFTEGDMERWHAEFERTNPEKHERFLRFLGIEKEEARAIRKAARAWFPAT